MEGYNIHFQVDLVIQLIDTTTGLEISGRRVEFTKDNSPLNVISRGGGNYIAININREDFTLGVNVYGYEKSKVKIHYEDLDKVMPVQPIFLVPMENIGAIGEFLSLQGILDGIESIEGVNINKPFCSISDFNEKKLEMSVYSPQGVLKMDDCFYGLIKDRTSYERIEVLKKTGDSKVLVKARLEQEFNVNAPIARVLFGIVDGNRYLFRIRDDASVLEYLIRYVVKGKECFTLVDFHKPETLSLV